MTKKPRLTLGEKAALYAKVRKALGDRVFQRVAENTGLTSETVRRVANGTASPSMGTVMRLAEYLGVERD